MKANPDGRTVASTDLLVPGIGELIGASQREDNFELLKKRIEELNMTEEDYYWYLNLSFLHFVLGKALTSLIFVIPVVYIINLSKPIPKPL